MNLEGEVTNQISDFNCFSEVIDHSSMAAARVPHHPRRLLLEMQANSTLSPSDTNPRIRSVSYDDNSNNEANFDTNMVIILAALLCALICALGLNSILRCALRCSRRFTVGNEDANAGTVSRLAAARGLKKRALKQIPVAAYTSGLNMKATECLICLGEFLDGEKVRVLPKCNHGFHVRCVDTWLLSHSSCPTCRQSLVEPPRPPPPEAPESGSREADVTVSVAADEIG